MGIQKTIVFNGKTYRLMGAGRYYLSQSTSNAGRRGAKGLHVAIWEFYSGKKVPKGFVVHHKDHNVFNNNFDNLECIPRGEHIKMHAEESKNNGLYKTEKWKEHLDSIRKQAAEWHKSSAGHLWHVQHGLEAAKKTKKPRETRKCEYCGEEFVCKQTKKQRFCSKRCANIFKVRNARRSL